LDGLRTLVRSPLTKIGRQILSALIVIEVHARDVVSNMIEEKVKNANDFEWISQLRYVQHNSFKINIIKFGLTIFFNTILN